MLHRCAFNTRLSVNPVCASVEFLLSFSLTENFRRFCLAQKIFLHNFPIFLYGTFSFRFSHGTFSHPHIRSVLSQMLYHSNFLTHPEKCYFPFSGCCFSLTARNFCRIQNFPCSIFFSIFHKKHFLGVPFLNFPKKKKTERRKIYQTILRAFKW